MCVYVRMCALCGCVSAYLCVCAYIVHGVNVCLCTWLLPHYAHTCTSVR